MGINDAVNSLEKKFGKGIVIKLGQSDLKQKYLPTGSFILDRCIGGGFPVGRIVEIFGPEGSGKSSLALHAIRECQKLGIICGYVDMEHAFNSEFAKLIGVDIEELNFSQPEFGEQALEVVESFVPECGLVIVDSVASLIPKAEIEGDSGDVHMGLQARLMSQAMRRLGPKVHKSGCCLLFINQIRMKIGAYGGGETTSGGLALKFFSSVRVDLRKRMGKDDLIEGGHKIEVKVIKNRCGPPFRRGMMNFYYDRGIDNFESLLDLSVIDGIIDRRGNTYSFGDIKLGTNRGDALNGLKPYYEEVLKIYNLKVKCK